MTEALLTRQEQKKEAQMQEETAKANKPNDLVLSLMKGE